MLRSKSIRRVLSALLIIIGATLLLLATPAWLGAGLVIMGLVLEIIGIRMQHQQK
jgi:hypothetical protein